MSEILSPEQQPLPEGLVESRVVGHIPSEALPWFGDTDPNGQVAISEAVFPEGSVYIASAIPNNLRKLTEEVRDKDPSRHAEGNYTRLDEFMLKAAHLEANNGAGQSNRIHLVRGKAGDYVGFTLKSYGESPRPNTRRMYYAHTNLGRFSDTLVPAVDSETLNPDTPVIIRLGYADKQNQVKVLKQLTGKSQRNLRAGRAGSI